jgi:hypothetical protein
MTTVILSIILAATMAQAGLRELSTQRTDRPAQIGNIQSPNDETLIARGWRYEPAVPAVAEGYVRQSIRLVEGDGRTGTWQIVDRLQSEIDAEAAAARLASFQPLIPQAHLFRILIRRNFGDGAETNREVGKDQVTAYFAGLTLAGTITATQASDGVLLARMFEDLEAWNGTGETWTLPWEVVP